jgi:hypothetical protein
MRVMLHEGRQPVQLSMMTPGAYVATLALITAGSLAMLPDGSICEPVEVFDHEPAAHEHRAQLAEKHPREDFRVVMNTDLTI